jgi:hypothetical protein
MTNTKDELRSRLSVALSEVALAERVLETTLRELGSGGPRAEKVTVTTIVADAFARVRKAREELSRVRELIDSE